MLDYFYILYIYYTQILFLYSKGKLATPPLSIKLMEYFICEKCVRVKKGFLKQSINLKPIPTRCDFCKENKLCYPIENTTIKITTPK